MDRKREKKRARKVKGGDRKEIKSSCTPLPVEV
jgi:hypothetical protein